MANTQPPSKKKLYNLLLKCLKFMTGCCYPDDIKRINKLLTLGADPFYIKSADKVFNATRYFPKQYVLDFFENGFNHTPFNNAISRNLPNILHIFLHFDGKTLNERSNLQRLLLCKALRNLYVMQYVNCIKVLLDYGVRHHVDIDQFKTPITSSEKTIVKSLKEYNLVSKICSNPPNLRVNDSVINILYYLFEHNALEILDANDCKLISRMIVVDIPGRYRNVLFLLERLRRAYDPFITCNNFTHTFTTETTYGYGEIISETNRQLPPRAWSPETHSAELQELHPLPVLRHTRTVLMCICHLMRNGILPLISYRMKTKLFEYVWGSMFNEFS